MSEENEKVEDFISLWKKKLSTDNTPSVIGDLQKENELLRAKITENIELIVSYLPLIRFVILKSVPKIMRYK